MQMFYIKNLRAKVSYSTAFPIVFPVKECRLASGRSRTNKKSEKPYRSLNLLPLLHFCPGGVQKELTV